MLRSSAAMYSICDDKVRLSRGFEFEHFENNFTAD